MLQRRGQIYTYVNMLCGMFWNKHIYIIIWYEYGSKYRAGFSFSFLKTFTTHHPVKLQITHELHIIANELMSIRQAKHVESLGHEGNIRELKEHFITRHSMVTDVKKKTPILIPPLSHSWLTLWLREFTWKLELVQMIRFFDSVPFFGSVFFSQLQMK